ncbi:MAG TPA: hypothetical protein VL490_02105 [Mucilaginibacter sp.]|nr:hypothetical protein [Mucilaginibacter sp.]
MALKLKPDMAAPVKTNVITNSLREAMLEFTGVKIIEALEIILDDLPGQQKKRLMVKVDDVIELVLYSADETFVPANLELVK